MLAELPHTNQVGHACMCTHTHARARTCAHIHTHAQACVCTRTRMCVHAHVHRHICTWWATGGGAPPQGCALPCRPASGDHPRGKAPPSSAPARPLHLLGGPAQRPGLHAPTTHGGWRTKSSRWSSGTRGAYTAPSEPGVAGMPMRKLACSAIRQIEQQPAAEPVGGGARRQLCYQNWALAEHACYCTTPTRTHTYTHTYAGAHAHTHTCARTPMHTTPACALIACVRLGMWGCCRC